MYYFTNLLKRVFQCGLGLRQYWQENESWSLGLPLPQEFLPILFQLIRDDRILQSKFELLGNCDQQSSWRIQICIHLKEIILLKGMIVWEPNITEVLFDSLRLFPTPETASSSLQVFCSDGQKYHPLQCFKLSSPSHHHRHPLEPRRAILF